MRFPNCLTLTLMEMARRINHREIKKKSAIIVDGETEKWYLTALARIEQPKYFDIKPDLVSRKDIRTCFYDLKEKLQVYDKVIWIVDLDVLLAQENSAGKGGETPLKKFLRLKEEFVKKYTNDKLEILINNPCLEYWFLLHFQETAKPYKGCSQVHKELKKHFPEYEKKEDFFVRKNIYNRLKSNLATAIKNAEKIGEFNKENEEMSVAEIYKLFHFLNIEL